MPNKQDFDQILDQTAAELRSAEPDAVEMQAAAARVFARLNAGTSEAADTGARIAGCADVQALLPAYRAGRLPEAREWLVQDHIRECAECRAAVTGNRKAAILPWRESAAPTKVRMAPGRRLAWAATVLVCLSAAGYMFRDQFLPAPAGPRATLEWTDGQVVLIADHSQRSIGPGTPIHEAEWVRTAPRSRAILRLRDGSRVELNERAELAVSENRRDTTVHLDRGNIIVQAAKRTSGHLSVTSPDATVFVTGTVFAVNRGMQGTRVSVVEGRVRVEEHDRSVSLAPGEQIATSERLARVPVRQEIAWSRNVNEHLKMLAETSALAKDMEQIRLPGLRYSSALLTKLPASTVLYVAVPNAGEALSKAHKLFEDRIRDSAAFREWWQQKNGAAAQQELAQAMSFVKNLSDYLGDEVVLAAASRPGGAITPAVLAEVRRDGLDEYLKSKLPAAGEKRPVLHIAGGVAVFAEDETAAQMFLGDAGLATTPFGQRIAQSYNDGVSMLFAADAGTLIRTGAGEQAPLRQLGADDLRYLIAEMREIDDHIHSSATVNFAGPRHGMASWLAAPAPMGSLDFVTPSATFAASFVVKEPMLLLEDLLALGDRVDGSASSQEGQHGLREAIARAEAELGIRIREDIAASLGNEGTFAVERRLLPVPAWKAVIEVRDPAKLQATMLKLLETANNHPNRPAQAPKVMHTQRDEGGRTLHRISAGEGGVGLEYTFVDGYMLMAADSETLWSGLRAREGWKLTQSHEFRHMLPPNQQPNFSAIVYYNLRHVGEVMDDLVASGLAAGEGREAMQRLAANTRPGLIYAYGGTDRIQIASTGGFFGLTLENIVASAGMSEMLAQALPNSRTASAGFRRDRSPVAVDRKEQSPPRNGRLTDQLHRLEKHDR